MWFVLVGLVPALVGYVVLGRLVTRQRPVNVQAVTLGTAVIILLLIGGLVSNFR